MKRSFWPGSLAGFVLASVAVSAPLRTTTNSLPVLKRAEVLPDLSRRPWWLFLSLDGGGVNYSAIDPAFDGARTGTAFGIRALLNRRTSDFVFEGGLGWRIISAKGTNPPNSFNPSSTTDTISTKTPYADLSVRYRIGPRFQIGPEFEYWLGTDYGLNEKIDSGVANNGKFIGAEVVYEWDGRRKYGIGGRWLQGLSVPGRSVSLVHLFFEIGFDAFGIREEAPSAPFYPGRSVEQLDRGDLEKAKSLTPSEPVPMNAPANPPPGEQNYVEPAPEVMSTPAPPPEEEMLAPPPPEPATGGAPPQVNLEEPLRATPTPAPVAAVVRKSMILSMGFNDLPFGFTDSSLPDTHQSRVRNMGRYLVKKKGVWKTLVVAGHTDERGSSKFNMDLSLRRAETVRRLLIEGGVPASRIKAVGYGETKPVDSRHNEKAWARNRRVELEFLKVTDSEAIKRTMDQ